MASSGVRNGVGPRMSAKPDRQGAGATPKTAAGKHRVSSAGGAGAYRRTSSGPLPAAAGGRAASDGGGLLCSLWLRSCGAGSGFGFGFGFWFCGV
jgi:hypothetical protein